MATLQQTPAVPIPSAGRAEVTGEPERGAGLRDLMPGEAKVLDLPGPDGASFVLTDRRIIHYGGGEQEAFYTSMRLGDISSVALTRRARDRKSLLWGVLGAVGAVGVWQVSSNGNIGAIVGAVVGLISLGLFADYWFRPGGLGVLFTSAGGTVRGEVEGKAAARAEAFVSQAEQMRTNPQQAAPSAGTSSRPAAADSGVRPSYPAV